VKPEASLKDPRLLHPLAWISLISGLVGLILGAGCGIEMKRPPSFDPMWALVWAICFGAIFCSIVSVALRRNPGSRLVCSIAAGSALLGAWCPIASFYGNYGTYPWFVVGGLAALSTVGAALCGLRVVPFVSTVFCGIWFYAPFLPASHSLPIVKRVNGLECTLLKLDGQGVGGAEFDLRAMNGQKLTGLVDLGHVDLEGMIGPIMPVEFDPSRVFDPRNQDDPESAPAGASALFRARAHGPEWTRSFDLKLTVRRWPKSAVGSTTLLLANLQSQVVRPATNHYSLAITGARWGQSQNRIPTVKCLRLTIDFSGFIYSGTQGTEIGIVDNLGDRIPLDGFSSVDVSPHGASVEAEIYDINPKAKSLRVDLYSETDTAKNRTVFDFGRVSATPSPE